MYKTALCRCAPAASESPFHNLYGHVFMCTEVLAFAFLLLQKVHWPRSHRVKEESYSCEFVNSTTCALSNCGLAGSVCNCFCRLKPCIVTISETLCCLFRAWKRSLTLRRRFFNKQPESGTKTNPWKEMKIDMNKKRKKIRRETKISSDH